MSDGNAKKSHPARFHNSFWVPNNTICGREGLAQKICCPYRIDPLKAAQESENDFSWQTICTYSNWLFYITECEEYAESRYVNQTVGGILIGEEETIKRVVDCVTSLETLIIGGEVAKEKEFPHMVRRVILFPLCILCNSSTFHYLGSHREQRGRSTVYRLDMWWYSNQQSIYFECSSLQRSQ